MTNLIADQKQFDNFTQNILPPLKDGEVYFVSLSARNKYLTADERIEFALGRTEMFGRTVGYGNWEYTMKKLAVNLDYRRTKTGLEYPEKAMVVYVNINPSNMVEASQKFAEKVMSISGEMVRAYRNDKKPNLKMLDKADRLLMNYIQKSTGTRHYLDIDIDAPESFKDELVFDLLRNDIEHHVIRTQGGFHVLVNRLSLNKSENNLHLIVDKLNYNCGGSGKGEVVFNKNAMVPMPGTNQTGKLVYLV